MRRPDWVSRLWGVLEACRSTPFEWGKHDCCLFAARCVDAMTDSDWASRLRYRGQRGALLFLKREGGLEAAVTARLGAAVDGRNARRGDVCLVPVEGGMGLGVCVGSTVAVAAESGVTFYELGRVLKFWRID